MKTNKKTAEAEYCKWRTKRGLWLPALYMLIIIAYIIWKIINPINITLDSIIIVIAIGVIVGLGEVILSKGKNLWFALACMIIILILEIFETGTNGVLASILAGILISSVLTGIQYLLCVIHKAKNKQNITDSGT